MVLANECLYIDPQLFLSGRTARAKGSQWEFVRQGVCIDQRRKCAHTSNDICLPRENNGGLQWRNYGCSPKWFSIQAPVGTAESCLKEGETDAMAPRHYQIVYCAAIQVCISLQHSPWVQFPEIAPPPHFIPTATLQIQPQGLVLQCWSML